MKDLIISSAMNYRPEEVACWINSIRAMNFDGDVVVLDFGLPEDTVKFLQGKGVTLYQCELNGRHIVVERFITMYTFLESNEFNTVLATDIKDVLFQKNPFPVSGDRIIICSENIKYEDEEWGDNNMKVSYPHMYERMKKYPIYNAGVIFGDTSAIKDFFLHIFHLSLLGGDPQSDQAAMNILIWSFPFLGEVCMLPPTSTMCANLGTTLADNFREKNASKLIYPPPKITEDGIVVNVYDEPYLLIHQYDRVAALKPLIQQKYGLKK